MTYAVVDAEMSNPAEETFCICPVVLNGNREVMEVVTGLSILTGQRPANTTILGVYHSDGKKAADEWLRRNLIAMSKFCSFGNPELVKSGLGLAVLRLFSENHPDDLKPLFGISELRDTLVSQYGIVLP